MAFWLDLFTGTTWDEFRSAGARISGFRPRMRNLAKQVQPGDVFLCYLTGVMRWVGALEVVGTTDDQTPIWKDVDFPVRFEVKPLVMLDAEHGVPMQELEGKVDFYAGAQDWGKFKAFIRQSPNPFRRDADGALILQLLHDAARAPVSRPYDPKKLARRHLYQADRQKGRTKIPIVVSVPEPEEIPAPPVQPVQREDGESTTRHTEIQFHLLALGAEMGLDVWVARNDRSRIWNGAPLGTMQRMVGELPTQFNEATNRTIEHIDVLWLKGNSIVAAFEIECTTSVYSGLLRMSDLLALQPNLDIRLYLVAPDDRRPKVEQEILRPTFALREKPLASVCGFLPFSQLMEKVEGIRRLGLAPSLRPEFLERAAEFFNGDSTD
jgi:hypothetical protein